MTGVVRPPVTDGGPTGKRGDAAVIDTAVFVPMAVFVVFVFGTWYALSLISNRNSQAEDRLERIGRPKSLTDIDLDSRKAGEERFAGLKETISSLGNSLEPQS